MTKAFYHQKEVSLAKMIEIETCCRTCMKSAGDGFNLVDLFEPIKLEECSLTLAEALVECTNMQIVSDDGLPQRLCDDCLKLLQVSYKFRSQARNAEHEFKNIIHLQTQVKKEEDEIKCKIENDYEDSFPIEDYDFSIPKDEDEKLLKCEECNKQFSKDDKFLKHIASHIALQCPICSKRFRKQSSLKKHLAKHKTKCVCGLQFESEAILLEHMVTHSHIEVKTESEEIFKCDICNTVYNKRRSLAMHKRTHKLNKIKKPSITAICDICKKELANKALLKRHLKIHDEEHPFKCTECSNTYSRQDQYRQHMRKHSALKSIVCPYCKRGFSQTCSLKEHIRTHTGETPYLCAQCGKSFANSSNLRQHMLRHSGVKPYACSLCPKTFSTKGQMSCHISTHSGAHPYSCEQCGASFTKPNSLKKHSLIHLGVRPFACDECAMRFMTKDHLKRHYRIHTGEKPYKCDMCERAFTQSNDLVKHKRSHVGQNVYQCTVCSMRFRLQSELKLHYPSHYLEGKDKPPCKDLEPPLEKDPPMIEREPPQCEPKDYDRTITITFNSSVLNKSDINGDITINISPECPDKT